MRYNDDLLPMGKDLKACMSGYLLAGHVLGADWAGDRECMRSCEKIKEREI